MAIQDCHYFFFLRSGGEQQQLKDKDVDCDVAKRAPRNDGNRKYKKYGVLSRIIYVDKLVGDTKLLGKVCAEGLDAIAFGGVVACGVVVDIEFAGCVGGSF